MKYIVFVSIPTSVEVELNDFKEGFGERAMMVTEIFKKQRIQVIVVPPKTIKIYRSERNTLKKLLDKEV